jgi:hypothetical protein
MISVRSMIVISKYKATENYINNNVWLVSWW